MNFAKSIEQENTDSERKSLPLILIVEDDKFFGEILVNKFKAENFRVERAVDGASALRLFAEYKPHCVLLDAGLPDMDGLEALQKIRRDPAGAKIPVIMMGNFNRQEDIKHALTFGANEFLPKMNFTTEDIVEHVRKILQEYYIDLR
jgi:two-component system, OmpR family, response regulator AdeR